MFTKGFLLKNMQNFVKICFIEIDIIQVVFLIETS
jgi:hypothetical protein